MSATIVSSIITGIVAITVCCISNAFQSAANKEQSNKVIALIEYRLNELSYKVEKHNGMLERLGATEQSLTTLWKRVDELKNEVEKLK